MTTITELLETLDKLHAEATPGEWEQRGRLSGVITGGPLHEFTEGSCRSQIFCATLDLGVEAGDRDANASFVIEAHNAYPQLAAEIRRLEAELANESVRFADFRAHVNAVASKAKQDTNEAMSLLVKFRAELAEAKKDSARLEEHSRILHWLLEKGKSDRRIEAMEDLYANIDGDRIEACRMLMNEAGVPVAHATDDDLPPVVPAFLAAMTPDELQAFIAKFNGPLPECKL